MTSCYFDRCYVSLPYTTATNEIDDPSLAYSAVLPLEVFGPGGSNVGVEGGTQLSLVTEATIPEITKETPGVVRLGIMNILRVRACERAPNL